MGAQWFDKLLFVEVCAIQTARQTEVCRTWLNSMPLFHKGQAAFAFPVTAEIQWLIAEDAAEAVSQRRTGVLAAR